MQDATVGKFVNLVESADVAGVQFVGFKRVFALQNQRTGSLDGLLVVVDVQSGTGSDATLMYAEDADLADERVAHDLEDVSHDGQRLVGLSLIGSAFLVDELSIVGFARRGQVADDHLHEVANADEVLRRGEAHRNDVGFSQGLRHGAVKSGGIHIAFFEIFFHRFVVDFHDAFDEGAVNIAHRHDVAFARILVKAVDDAGAALGGKVDRQNAVAEGFLEFVKKFMKVDVGSIDLVDDDHAAQSALFGPFHHAARHQFDALGGVDHHSNRFDGVKSGQRLTNVVRAPRGVNDVNAHRGQVGHSGVDVRHGHTKRVTDRFFLRVVVAYGIAAFDGAGFSDGAGTNQHSFDKTRLAGSAVPDQGYSTKVFGEVIGHRRPSFFRKMISAFCSRAQVKLKPMT